MNISIVERVKNRIKGGPGLSGNASAGSIQTIGPLSSMLGPSGRVTLASLNWYFQESDRDEFIEFVQNPVLVGSALTADYLSGPKQIDEEALGSSDVSKRNQTMIVNSDERISKKSGPGTSLPYAIYPLVKRADADSPADSFTLGRAKNSDMVMKDMAISKLHAIIRFAKGHFYISDCGSTNGSRLNGRRITDNPVKLHDKEIISLGNHNFTFLTAASLHDLLSHS